jgi:hypothetical protein
MNGKHFEIGTIQAFLDGETAPDVSLRLTDHVASCDSCARLLATAEEESSIVFSALERELNSLVPTQRLWTRINESIAVEQSKTTVWERIAAYVRGSLINPSLAAAAGVVMVAGMLAILWMPRSDGNMIVGNPGGTTAPGPARESSNPPLQDPTPVTASVDPLKENVRYTSTSNLPADKIGRMIRADYRRPVDAPEVIPASAYLPGEESYVRTISDLKQTVDSQKDAVLNPSSRVAYERDMAVVDDSIKRVREVVRKNPRNQAARQVLYSSYQDKIDLMNSVAQREEMMATLK